MKGRTKWFNKQRDGYPTRRGWYECIVQISRSVPPILWMLRYDGTGFLCPMPMVVLRWRGQTKRAAAIGATK